MARECLEVQGVALVVAHGGALVAQVGAVEPHLGAAEAQVAMATSVAPVEVQRGQEAAANAQATRDGRGAHSAAAPNIACSPQLPHPSINQLNDE